MRRAATMVVLAAAAMVWALAGGWAVTVGLMAAGLMLPRHALVLMALGGAALWVASRLVLAFERVRDRC